MRVLCVCVLRVCGVCAESVCVGCVLMMWCAELCRYVWCWVVCWVVSVVCGVLLCVLRVWRGLFNMRAFCRHTRKRFEPTHGDVLNLHTGRREVRGSLISLSSLLSFSPLFLLSLFLRSLPSFSFSFSSFSISFSLSETMTVITRPVGSLCTHSSDLP